MSRARTNVVRQVGASALAWLALGCGGGEVSPGSGAGSRAHALQDGRGGQVLSSVAASQCVSIRPGQRPCSNFTAFVDAIVKAKPAGAKGTYIQRVAVSSTMGPVVKVDPQSVTGGGA